MEVPHISLSIYNIYILWQFSSVSKDFYEYKIINTKEKGICILIEPINKLQTTILIDLTPNWYCPIPSVYKGFEDFIKKERHIQWRQILPDINILRHNIKLLHDNISNNPQPNKECELLLLHLRKRPTQWIAEHI